MAYAIWVRSYFELFESSLDFSECFSFLVLLFVFELCRWLYSNEGAARMMRDLHSGR